MRHATLQLVTPTSTEPADCAAVDEGRLLEALAAGDPAAAEALARRTYRATYSALLKMTGDRELASDLTQETYGKAWASLSSFNGRSRFATWLYRIAFNVFISHTRRPRPVAAPVADLPEPAVEARAERRLETEQRAERLRRAVQTLPEPLQLTVTARFWGEVSVAEIARLDGVSETAIRKRLRRAEDRLRRALGEEDR
ncbi:MAG: sigma-70 family RNA polymerase sigma factor [Acidobacteriota bacterium]